MPRTITTTCDQCGKDLSTTSQTGDCCLVLANSPIPNPSGFSFAGVPDVPLKKAKYFCRMHCLEDWIMLGAVEWKMRKATADQ